MEDYIKISNLNDFIFCPRSIYFHNLYMNFEDKTYYSDFQINGKISHRTIDKKRYSSKKKIIQGLEVFSEELGIIGKIDVLDLNNMVLIERKKKIKKIYEGYYLQIYAQFFCLKEMGFNVKKIFFHSLDDNKRYNVKLPGKIQKEKIKNIILKMKSFSLDLKFKQNPKKCLMCIYKELCDYKNDD